MQGDGVTNDENKRTYYTPKSVAPTSRPYKIQDINKLDISFPLSIINSAPEVVKPNMDITARLKSLKENNGNVSAFKPPKTHPIFLQNDQEKTTEQVGEDYENTALDGTLPTTTNLETAEFHIDHSMFNPKTLLQCLSEDTGFLPPPVQFTDDVNTMHEPFFSPAGIEIEENNYEYPDRSISNKKSHADTPTKEIETWTLSQDNEYTRCDLKESCTLMGINSPMTSTAAYNLPQNNRKAKLGKFTFKAKNKLKYK